MAMQIKVNHLKTYLDMISKKLKNYEEDCRNFYNELNNISSYWQDNHAERFFDNVLIEKNKIDTMQNEILSIKDVYKYMVESYEKIGNKLEFNLDLKEDTLYHIDTYIAKLENIIFSYNRLNLSFCSKEKQILENHKQELIREVEYVQKVKENLKKIFGQIEEIEKNIQYKLSKLNLEVIKETDISEFIG